MSNDCLLSYLTRTIKETTTNTNFGTAADCLVKLRSALDRNDKKVIKSIVQMPASVKVTFWSEFVVCEESGSKFEP